MKSFHSTAKTITERQETFLSYLAKLILRTNLRDLLENVAKLFSSMCCKCVLMLRTEISDNFRYVDTEKERGMPHFMTGIFL
jgi:hypothetical protein